MAKDFVVYGVDGDDGSHCELERFESSGEARAWALRYMQSAGGFGGHAAIVVYDERGEGNERMFYWENGED